jgi:muramidase (phage lysozyme)
MLASAEGTIGKGDDGYNMIVEPGGFFVSYADHPRKMVQVQPGLFSTAAGRYQLLAKYFSVYKATLNLPDFGPLSQDLIAIQQIKECHALQDIIAGDLVSAVGKCSRIWASLPGNEYGQRQVPIADLRMAYIAAGGNANA